MRNLLLSIYCFCLSLTTFAEDAKIASPDGNYRMRVYDRDGMIYYSVDYKNRTVILESLLGISGSQP